MGGQLGVEVHEMELPAAKMANMVNSKMVIGLYRELHRVQYKGN